MYKGGFKDCDINLTMTICSSHHYRVIFCQEIITSYFNYYFLFHTSSSLFITYADKWLNQSKI